MKLTKTLRSQCNAHQSKCSDSVEIAPALAGKCLYAKPENEQEYFKRKVKAFLTPIGSASMPKVHEICEEYGINFADWAADLIETGYGQNSNGEFAQIFVSITCGFAIESEIEIFMNDLEYAIDWEAWYEKQEYEAEEEAAEEYFYERKEQ